MLQYVIDHMDHSFSIIQSFLPEALHFTLNDGDVSTVEYQISGSAVDLDGDPVITGDDFISPWNTHFQLRYGPDVIIMAGPHTSVNMKYGDNYMSVAGGDWLAYFNRRFFPFDGRPDHVNDYVIGTPPQGLSYEATSVDITDVLTAILDQVLGRLYSIPFSYTLDESGIILDYYRLDLADTTTLLSIVKDVCANTPGVAYEIQPNLTFITASPRFYGDPNAIANDSTNPNLIWTIDVDHPPLNLDFTNSGPASTHIQGEGDGTTSRSVVTYGNEANQEVYWRLDSAYQFTDAITRDSVDLRTQEQLAFDLNPIHEIPIDLDPATVDQSNYSFGTNYITNGDFEINTSSWSGAGSGATITRDTSVFRSGVASGRVNLSGINKGTTCAITGLAPSTTYTMIVYVKYTSVGGLINTSLDGAGFVSTSTTASGNFDKIQLSFTTGSSQTTTNLLIAFGGANSGVVFYVDDASLFQGGTTFDGFFWTNFKPGRAIWVDLQLLAHHIQSAHHIVSIDCTVQPNGSATASITQNQIYDTSGDSNTNEG